MKLTSYNICKKSLDFQPDTPWPEDWPAFAWEKKIIAGFKQEKLPVLNFQAEDVKFLHLFHSCHPKLNLSELSRITLKWKFIEKTSFSWKDFFSLYNLQNPDFLVKILKVFSSTPPSFQKWADKRELHPYELRIFNSLENPIQANFIFQWIAEKNLSHSSGIKILEWGIELLLMNIQVDKILNSNLSPEEVLQAMEQKRRPLSSSSDLVKNKKLKQMIWPAHVHAQWQRRGDKTGLEIKIWCQNQKGLEEQIQRIHKLSIFNQLNASTGRK